MSRAILTDAAPVEEGAARTVAFRATAAELPGLSEAEKSLLEEWLQRSIATPQG